MLGHHRFICPFRRPTTPLAVGLPPLSTSFHIIAFTLCYLLLLSPSCLMCLGPMKSSSPDLTEIKGSLLSPDHQRGETDQRSEIRQMLRRVATVHASAPPSRPSRSILAAASKVFLSEGLSPLPRSHRHQKGLEDYPRRRRLLRIGRYFPSPSGHLLQGVLCSFCASSPIPKLPVNCCFVTLLSSLHLLCRAAE
ncbi:hypothetical protein DY000_02008337 [Brassica cretica]|uniref:Uncharacterized protein n=1 Tax=Brassica cretica TaxID=69181 RepID=A0ABQ7BSJ8_BRACR|nr:hypothetical protein DY000_02008337 [Brassica cretica]